MINIELDIFGGTLRSATEHPFLSRARWLLYSLHIVAKGRSNEIYAWICFICWDIYSYVGGRHILLARETTPTSNAFVIFMYLMGQYVYLMGRYISSLVNGQFNIIIRYMLSSTAHITNIILQSSSSMVWLYVSICLGSGWNRLENFFIFFGVFICHRNACLGGALSAVELCALETNTCVKRTRSFDLILMYIIWFVIWVHRKQWTDNV